MKETMSAESGVAAAFIYKVGIIKVLSLGSALVGAGIMTIFRPPANRTELFKQAAVALGASLLFGTSAVQFLDYHLDWIDLTKATMEQILQFNAGVHGFIGAVAWGFFGGIATLRDRFATDPVKTVKDAKDAIS